MNAKDKIVRHVDQVEELELLVVQMNASLLHAFRVHALRVHAIQVHAFLITGLMTIVYMVHAPVVTA